MKRNLKLFLLTLLGTWMAGSAMADDLYLVGDGTPIGWQTGETRQATKMNETSSGVYVWAGLLKHGGEGFKICNSSNGWNGYHPSANGFAMGESGSDKYTEDNVSDWKWNPTNTDWEYYTVTLNKNEGTLSWQKGAYDVLAAGTDGCISIGTAEDLNKLALMCRNNVNNVKYDVKLTADIDYTAYKNNLLGSIGISQAFPFSGVFDGQGHTIKIAFENVGLTRTGLFAYVKEATIKNLVVEGTATSAGNNCVGGLGGRSDGDGTFIENVVVKTAVSYTGSNGDATCGGFFANMEGKAVLTNCAFYGSLDAGTAEGNGGLVGWAGSGANNKYTNCIVAPNGAYTMNGNSKDFARNDPSVTNCYKVTSDDARLASGEMAYILNGNSSENVNWYQTIGTDAYPMPFGTAIVYANGAMNCDGTPKEGTPFSFSNTKGGNRDDHQFSDGFCSVCHTMQPDFMTAASDGFFEIANAVQLNWFAAYVNTTDNKAANARLTKDINFSSYDAMIGNGDQDDAYQGTFDGQGHTVTVNYSISQKNVALFRYLKAATIKNLLVDGTINNETESCSGGIFAGSRGATVVENCVSYVNFERQAAGDATIGGIGAYMHDNGTLRNVAFYGAINTPNAEGNGGLLGYANGGGNVAVINSVVSASKYLFGGTNSVSVARNTGNLTNTYVVNAGNATQTEQKDATAEQMATGELCYLLNGSVSGGEQWYQLIGTDAAPLPIAKTGAVVYVTNDLDCSGKPKGEPVYTNTKGDSKQDDHQFVDGFCSVCGALQTDYVKADAGILPIANAKQLIWFAAYATQVDNKANAKLTADITMDDSDLFPGIGNADNKYAGTFDGQKHIISNLVVDNLITKLPCGFFNEVTAGAVIKNFTLDETCYFVGDHYVGAFIGHADGNGEVLLEQLGNEAPVVAMNQNAGGIIGCNTGGQLKLKLTNCYNIGEISGNNECGGISGWLGNDAVTTNCYNMGLVQADGSESFARGNNIQVTNCFDPVTDWPALPVSDLDDFTNGVIFEKLVQGAGAGIWYLSAETGGHPVLYVTDYTTTGISSVKANDGQADAIYDLQGRRVNGQVKAGLYIINGRKVVLK